MSPLSTKDELVIDGTKTIDFSSITGLTVTIRYKPTLTNLTELI